MEDTLAKTPKETLILEPIQDEMQQSHSNESEGNHQKKRHHKRLLKFFVFLVIVTLGSINGYLFLKCFILENQQHILTKEMVTLSDFVHQNLDSLNRDVKINIADIRGKITSFETKSQPVVDKEAILEMVKAQLKELPKEASAPQNADQKNLLPLSLSPLPDSLTCAFFVKVTIEKGQPYENVLRLLQKAIGREQIPLTKVQGFLDVLTLHAKEGVLTRTNLYEALPTLDITSTFLPSYLEWLNDFIKISSSNSSSDLKEKVILSLNSHTIKEAINLIKAHLEVIPSDASIWNAWLDKALLFQTTHESLDQLVSTLINHYMIEEKKP